MYRSTCVCMYHDSEIPYYYYYYYYLFDQKADNTCTIQNTISYTISYQLWNNLPHYLQQCQSLNIRNH